MSYRLIHPHELPLPKRVYLAGPMTNLPAFNIPEFDRAAHVLRSHGLVVHSPAELDDPDTRARALASPDGAPGSGSVNGETWGDFLARDVKLIADSGLDAVVVLPGWAISRGARLETFVGHALCGLPVYHFGWPLRLVLEVDLHAAWTKGT